MAFTTSIFFFFDRKLNALGNSFSSNDKITSGEDIFKTLSAILIVSKALNLYSSSILIIIL